MLLRVLLTALAITGINAVTACAATFQTLKFGEFALNVPTTMVLKADGIDSQAGTIQDAFHQMSYDYGAYSDPLNSVDGAVAFRERVGSVDGLAARFVSFSRTSASGQTQACEGVHVPFVRKSVIGSIRLTLLLCGDVKTTGAMAAKIFTSVKFHTDVSR